MDTVLYDDFATKITFIDRPRGESEVRITVAIPGQWAQQTLQLELDDVDRLLAVRESAKYPVADISEFFQNVHSVRVGMADKAAYAFMASAGSLADIVYG